MSVVESKLLSLWDLEAKMDEGPEEKKCKRVKKNVIKNKIAFDDYRDCLFGGGPQLRTMNTIRSRQQDIYTERINKTALSADDDKRIICEDGIRTMAYGHYLSKNNI